MWSAFRDEISKIAEVPPPPAQPGTDWRKFAKGELAAALGLGAGTAAVMLAHKGTGEAFGTWWGRLPPATRMKYLAAAGGVATLGGGAAASMFLASRAENARKAREGSRG